MDSEAAQMPEKRCVPLCRESACLPGSSYHPMLLTCLAQACGGGGEGQRTRLHYAASEGDVVRIRGLVKAGADVEARDGYGSTPLIYACKSGREAAALLLLDLGADGSKGKDEYGISALHWASENCLVSVIRRLVDMGADINAQDGHGRTPH